MATLQGLFQPAPQKKTETDLENPYVLFIKKNNSNNKRVAILIEKDDIISENNLENGETNIRLPDNSFVYLKTPNGFEDVFANQILDHLDDATITYTPAGHSTY